MDRAIIAEGLGICWDLSETIAALDPGIPAIQDAAWLLQAALKDLMDRLRVPEAALLPADPQWVHPIARV